MLKDNIIPYNLYKNNDIYVHILFEMTRVFSDSYGS